MGVGLAVVALLVALMQGVFCKTWVVMLPRSILGVSGSCDTVPCHLTVNNKPENIILNCLDGVQTGEETPVFITRSPYVIQMKKDSDLTRKECTTTSHMRNSEMETFHLDCLENLRFTFNYKVNFTVEAGLSAPQLTSAGQVSEGAQARLQCSAPAPCLVLPPSITWLPRDDSRQEDTRVELNMERQVFMTSVLTFIASADHHNQSIACSVSYPLTGGGSAWLPAETQRLHVLYAPRVPVATLSTSGPVSDGDFVTLTCSSDANPPVSRYTWFRSDAGELTKTGEGETLILQVGQQDSGVYLCEAQSQRGSKRSKPVSLQINAGSRGSVSAIPYVLCGLMLVLYVLAVVVAVYKYQGLSRRLKQIEQKREHTYTDLTSCRVTSDYDQLQPQQPKVMPPPDFHNYENLQKRP